MSSKSIVFYKNNQIYRTNILLNQEEQSQFQKLPFKQNDSEVESGSLFEISKRDLSARCEEYTHPNNLNITIMQALDESQKQRSKQSSAQIQQDCSQILMPLPEIYPTQNSQKKSIKVSNPTVNMEESQFRKVEPIRLMKVLKLLVNIQHFFRILSMNSRIFNKLTPHQHYLIGDISTYYSKSIKLKSGNRMMSVLNNFQYFIIKLIQILNNQIFTPSNYLIKTWDSLQSILILFSTFLLNLELFFEMDISNYQLLFQILFNVFAIDIFIELNTGVLKKGNIIYDRNFILKSYFKNTFIQDFLGNIPLFFYITKGQVNHQMRLVNNILFTFKWVKIYKVLKQLAHYISYEKNHKNIFDLLKLLIFVIGVCHVFCLFWHGLVIFEVNNGITNNWLASKNLLEASIYERYIYSFYFLAVTMATVGYGDITPQNKYEVLLATITIFVTCVVYAFSLNTIGGIIENIEKRDKTYKKNLQIIHGLMREEEVSSNLKIQVSNYIEYLYKESNEIQKKQEKLIIEKLSTKLRNDLSLEIQGRYLNNIPLFKSIKEKEKIAKMMEEQLYSPAEIIFTQGDLDDCSLYYIVKGSVSIIFEPDQNSNREQKQIQLIQKKEYFGEISFITGNSRTFTAKAADFCRIYKINREQFLSVIKEHDQDFENFQMIKEAINFNNNFKFCSIFCSICESGKHISVNCPKTHLTFTNQIIISRFNSYSPQKRAAFTRRKNKLNYMQKIELLSKQVYEINNNESLFEILDKIDFGLNDLDYKDSEKERKANQSDNTFYYNRNSIQNKSLINNLDSLKKIQQTLEQQLETVMTDKIKRQSKNHLSIILQQSLNNIQKNLEQTAYPQRNAKNSFIICNEQNDEVQKINQITQANFIQAQLSSISSEEDTSSNSEQEVKSQLSSSQQKMHPNQKNHFSAKKSMLVLDQLEDDQLNQNQGVTLKQNTLIHQKRNSNFYNIQTFKNNDHSNDIDQNILSQINDVKRAFHNNESEKIDITPINIGNTIKPQRGRSQIIQLDNLLNLVQNNVSNDQQDFPKINSLQTKNDSLRQFQQLSPKKSFIFKNHSFQLGSQVHFNNESQRQSFFTKYNTVRDYLNNEKQSKTNDETTEFSRQSSYYMLQVFDKAKIFKQYQPNFNYPEIIQKWISYLIIRQKKQSNSQSISFKKKRLQNKLKQIDIQLSIQ
ncbi:hypothetical protein ABPG74_004819 [Tetrahymena malaccensis]